MKKFVLLLAVAALAAGCNNAARVTDLVSPRVRQMDEIDDFYTIDPYLGEKIMLYPVNRILDMTDLVTLNAGVGPGLQANVHLTRGVQAGLGGSATARLGLNTGREFGFYRQTGAEASFLPLTWESCSRKNVSSWESVREVDHKANGLSLPGYRIYIEDVRDYWSIGGQLPLGVGSIEAEVHPKEFFDLVLGIFFFDIRNDDLGVKTGENRMLE